MKKITFIFVLGFLSLSFTAFSQIKVDSNGNTTIKHGTFSQGNDAVLYLGATDHYIKSVFGYGVTIGTAGMADWIKLKQYTGCVGLGREPQYALDVSGTIRAQTTIYPSDIRFKTNIQNLENPINKIKQIQGVSYNFSSNDTITQKCNNQSSFNKNFGFIAQDFQKIYPELVYEDSLGYLSIDYISVIPVLLEAMKEQQDIINDFVTRVEIMEENCCNNALKSASLTTGTDTMLANDKVILYQNIPNPFTENTRIDYYLSHDVQNTVISIYNLSGTQLKSIPLHHVGNGNVIIYGNELKAGIYLYSLITDGKVIDTKRMVLTD